MIDFIFRLTGWIFAVINFLWIVASPTIFGIIIGGLIYNANQTLPFLIIGLFFALTGFVLGIIWGINVWKKHGTTLYMSRLQASPDLDSIGVEKKNDDENVIEMTPNDKKIN